MGRCVSWIKARQCLNSQYISSGEKKALFWEQAVFMVDMTDYAERFFSSTWPV